jgi:hypothetical protein
MSQLIAAFYGTSQAAVPNHPLSPVLVVDNFDDIPSEQKRFGQYIVSLLNAKKCKCTEDKITSEKVILVSYLIFV